MRALLLQPLGNVLRRSRAAVATIRPPQPAAIRRLRSLPVALAASLLFLAQSPRTAFAQYPGELSGRVADAISGTPVQNVLVEVLGTELSAHTDGRGEFRLRGLEPGRHSVRLSRVGYATLVREIEIQNGRAARLTVDLEARPFAVPEVRTEADRPDPPGTLKVSRGEIESIGARTAADALAGRAGLVVRRRGATGPETVSIRGSSPDQVLVLLDGAPINDPVTGAADLSTIAASQIESITVLKGSQSAVYGPGAQAGVVLIASRVSTPPLGARAAAGSLGAWSGELEGGGAFGRSTWAAGGYARGAEGEFTYTRPEALGGGRATRVNNDVYEAGGFLTAGGRLAGGQVRARGGYTQLERGLPGLSFLPSPAARQEFTRWRGQAAWDRSQRQVRFATQVHGVAQTTRFADPDPPLGLPYDSRTRSIIVGGRFSTQLQLEGALESLTGGLQLEDQRYESTSFDEGAPAGRTDFGIFAAGALAFAETTLSPRLVGAVRLDRDELDDLWRVTHELTAYAQTGPLAFYVRHASSYKPPTFGDQFFSEGIAVQPNPELRAESIPNDLGAGFDVEGPIGASAAARFGIDAYSADVKGMIIWAPDSRFVWSPRNFDVKRRGFDIEGEVSFPARNLDLRASYSLARTTYDRPSGDDSQQVIYRPRHTGSLTTYWRPGRWDFRFDLRYIGVRYPVPAPVNALDAYWQVDLQLRRTFDVGAWQLAPRVIIDRLTDNEDSLIFGYPEPGRTVRIELAASPR